MYTVRNTFKNQTHTHIYTHAYSYKDTRAKTHTYGHIDDLVIHVFVYDLYRFDVYVNNPKTWSSKMKNQLMFN